MTLKHNTSGSDSAAGLATILAIAALANPRHVPDSKSIILDAQVYVGSPSCESLIGALRFYNGTEIEFSSDAGLYLIYATFARMEDGVDIQPDLAISEYKFVGDLQWVIPLAPPSDSKPDDCSSEEATPFRIDPRQRAYIHVSGMATNCQKDAGTFTLEIEQYISALKDIKNAASKPIKPIALILCVFPDSPRFRNGKPVPYNKRFISASGFLVDVAYKNQSVDTVEYFTVTVDHIAFLGQANTNLNDALPNTLDTSSNTHAQNKGLINYSRVDKRHMSVSQAVAPVQTEAEGPSRKRQRRVGDESSSNSVPTIEK
ncbi:hypothetical protein BDZ97DRAFT_1912130 [Flammula alnicola]|nr:hypothetical protein BDZ97DRAFT_1912130 [Flammula alnicola]